MLPRILIGVILLASIGAIIWLIRTPEEKPPVVSSQPATAPTTRKVEAPPKPRGMNSYIDLIQGNHKSFPTTQPLVIPVAFEEAAHLTFKEPVYLCSRGDLWFTHAEAQTIASQIPQPAFVKEQMHFTKEKVVYVHWIPTMGVWQPVVIYPTANPDEYTAQANGTRQTFTLAKADWSGARSIQDTLLIPAGDQMAKFELGRNPRLEPIGPNPRILLATNGPIAWSENGFCKQLVDNRWVVIDEKILEPLPLIDGSFLKIYNTAPGKIELKMESPATAEVVDEKAITDLVDQLSDTRAEVRQKAYSQLQRYGPSSWPVLQKLIEEQPPEAQLRMRALLRNKETPSLGGYKLVDKSADVVARLPDGGIVLRSQSGAYVTPPNSNDPLLIAPAWLSIRPGRYIEALPKALITDFVDQKTQLHAFGDEWIVSDAVQGPRRFVGNGTIPLVNEGEQHFTQPLGIDRRGRWLFRDNTKNLTLIIDPTIPDPTPKLPVWRFTNPGGTTGWDDAGWPVMTAGGSWALREFDWAPLEKDAKVYEELPASAKNPALADPPLLVDSTGSVYYDGKTKLRVTRKDAPEINWTLPPEATGTSEPKLFRIKDGTLFLFNQTGRVLRIRPTPEAAEPFTVEAVFTRNIPDTDAARRIWQDPAGRIIIALGTNQLTILFPTGTVPQSIQNMIPAEQD